MTINLDFKDHMIHEEHRLMNPTCCCWCHCILNIRNGKRQMNPTSHEITAVFL